MASPSSPSPERRETGRVEAFSDGVFAIAATLLVLTIPVPHPSPGTSLAQVVLTRWPDFVAYAVSFLTILVMWINHHALFRLITRVDRHFLVLNGLLLLLVTFVNYPTALVADFIETPDRVFAAALYSATLVLIAICFGLIWGHASRGRRLLAAATEPRIVRMVGRQYRFGPLLYLAAFALAFVPEWGAWASIGLNAGLALYFAFTVQIERAHI